MYNVGKNGFNARYETRSQRKQDHASYSVVFIDAIGNCAESGILARPSFPVMHECLSMFS
jgi:hypothetical protein